MLFEELVESFMYSRKYGVSGARGVARQATLDFYAWGLEHFIKFMHDTRKKSNYEEINRNDMRAFVEFTHGNPAWGVSSRSNLLRCVRALMHFVERDSECQEANLKSHASLLGIIPKNKMRETIPTLKEVKTFRDRFDTKRYYGLRNYTLFSLILGTGLRNGEVRHLKVTDIHFDQAMLHVPEEGKTGSRLVPMDSSLVGILKAWFRRRQKTVFGKTSPWLFHGRKGVQLQESAIRQIFGKLQRGSTKIERITPHSLRHVFGTHYLAKSKNMERTRLILGHKSYETTKIYLHMVGVNSDEAKTEMEDSSPLKAVNSTH